MQLAAPRGSGVEAVAMDGKTTGGVWEDGEQLRALPATGGFSLESAVALDQVALRGHLDEPPAAQAWIQQVTGAY